MTQRKTARPLIGALAFIVVVVIGRGAGAATLASAPLFSLSSVNLQCELTNVTTRPVEVLSTTVLDADRIDITDFTNCVGSLQPGEVCIFTSREGTTNSNPHALVKINGTAKAIRGQCALFDGATQTLSTSID